MPGDAAARGVDMSAPRLALRSEPCELAVLRRGTHCSRYLPPDADAEHAHGTRETPPPRVARSNLIAC